MADVSKVASAQVDAHAIYLFHSLSDQPDAQSGFAPLFPQGRSPSTADLLAGDASLWGDGSTDGQRDELLKAIGDQPFWQPMDVKGLESQQNPTSDLDLALGAIMSGGAPRRARFWVPNTSVTDCLLPNRIPGGSVVSQRSGDLVLSHRPAATKRIAAGGAEPIALSLMFERLFLVSFDTGVSFVVARVQFTRSDGLPLKAVELVESVAALSRFNNFSWRQATEGSPGTKPKPFTLGTLIRSLVTGETDETLTHTRARLYAFARLSEHVAPEDAELLAAHLCRRYSFDYDLVPQEAEIEFSRDFRTIRHAASHEGMASVVCPSPDGGLTDFMRNWHKSPLPNTYIPIFLGLLHEERFIRTMRSRLFQTDRQIMPVDGSLDESQAKRLYAALQDNIDQVTLFQRDHVFRSPSQISTHLRMSTMVRRALLLDERMSELDGDMSAISERLAGGLSAWDSYRAEVKDVRNYWLVQLSATFAAGLAAFSGLKDLSVVVVEDDPATSAIIGGIGAAFVSLVVWLVLKHSSSKPSMPDMPAASRLFEANIDSDDI